MTLVCTLLLTACTTVTLAPDPLPSPPVTDALKYEAKEDVQVAVGILNDLQGRQHFGVDLASRDLQAVWVRIRNDSSRVLWFLTAAMDPDYYTASEAAFLFKGSLSDEDWLRLTRYFSDQAPRQSISPGQSTEGYILVKRSEGGRYINIELAGHEKLLRFGFAIPVADGYFDFEGIAPERIYGDLPRPDLNETELRAALRDLPCCTSDADGENQGDPLNMALVGSFDEVMTALARSGWSFTHRISLGTVGRLVDATLSGESYRVAPVSALFVFGRPQDIALQRARSWISQRNHMRLWLAPFRYEGRSVWVGQISRDVGIKITSKSPTLTTHVIDPYVDEAREYLLQGLLHHQSVKRFGFVTGSEPSTPEDPRTNLTDDPYFTDGLRLVVVLAQQPTPPHHARNFHWRELDLSGAAPPQGGGDSNPAMRSGVFRL